MSVKYTENNPCVLRHFCVNPDMKNMFGNAGANLPPIWEKSGTVRALFPKKTRLLMSKIMYLHRSRLNNEGK